MKHTQTVWQTLQQLPRYPLIRGTTPLLPLTRLSQQLGGTEIWCKRDDLINFGLGGNKIRGLELLAADALVKNANVLVTGAGVQSNHVRATAAVASHLGLACQAVFWGCKPAIVDGNYRATLTFGAKANFTGDAERSSVDTGIDQLSLHLREQNLIPYPIPRGGACALGALGHALAARELFEQCRQIGLSPGTIILATGSGGTHAGWLLGSRLLGNPWQIESYTVSREAESVTGQIVQIANQAAELLGWPEIFSTQDVTVQSGFIGAGYGIPSPAAADAIRLVGRLEGFLLDPTYTGKAMAGLLSGLQKAPTQKPQVFIHTGGEPAFFAGDGSWLC